MHSAGTWGACLPRSSFCPGLRVGCHPLPTCPQSRHAGRGATDDTSTSLGLPGPLHRTCVAKAKEVRRRARQSCWGATEGSTSHLTRLPTPRLCSDQCRGPGWWWEQHKCNASHQQAVYLRPTTASLHLITLAFPILPVLLCLLALASCFHFPYLKGISRRQQHRGIAALDHPKRAGGGLAVKDALANAAARAKPGLSAV